VACQKVRGKKRFEELSAAMVRQLPVPTNTWLRSNLGNLSQLDIVVGSVAIPLNPPSTLNND